MDFNLLSALAAFAMLLVFGLPPGALASKSKSGGSTTSCDATTGWYLGGTKCFKMVLSSTTAASAARTACSGMGSGVTLACPRSQNEMGGIFLSVFPDYITTTSHDEFWIGINDVDTDRGSANTDWACFDQTEGTGNFTFWDDYPSSTANYDCVYIDIDDGYVFENALCTNTRNGYVCEKAA